MTIQAATDPLSAQQEPGTTGRVEEPGMGARLPEPAARRQELKRELGELNQRFLTFARQNPGTCLLGAAALGFVVGRLAARA
jgi:hypothetical protein